MPTKSLPSPARLWWMRAVSWLRRNPDARATALELSAVSLRLRADMLQADDDRNCFPDNTFKIRAMLATAEGFEKRAQELRSRA